MKQIGLKSVKENLLGRHDLLYLYLRTARCALSEGPAEARRRYREYVNVHHPYAYRGHKVSRRDRKAQRAACSPDISFSLIVLLPDIPRRRLRAAVRSLRAQTCPGWEMCIVDESGNPFGPAAKYGRRMERRDPRISFLHPELKEGGTGGVNAALERARGTYIGFLGPEDLLHPSALYEIGRTARQTGADFLYTDEGLFRRSPRDIRCFRHKPDYSPDLLRSMNYLGGLTLFRRELMERAGGGLRREYEGNEMYDLVLRLTERAEQIVHIPKELYYRRSPDGSTSPDFSGDREAAEAGRRALAAHLERLGLQGTPEDSALPSTFQIRYAIEGNPRISIVIPNMDHVGDLKRCLESIRRLSTWKNREILIVENNSRQEETFQFYREQEALDPDLRVLRRDGEFNFADICNFGVSQASGDYILLMNNDMEVITPGWLEEMLMFAQRRDVGAVGCMLYYPDDTVQHAGVILGLGAAAGHSHRWARRGDPGNLFRLTVSQNLSAVTAACMMLPKRVYEEVSGMDGSFRVAFNDVDLCLKIREKGYLIVFTPYAELYHYESRSRGSDDRGEKRKRFEAEAALLRKKWKRVFEKGDPYYNPNLTRRREDFSLRDEDERF
ncbi:MAG: glycosyltransferase family 2 protein [Clostridia bacterium]|nr:glycosyltransferase family 2 protein [Clostridia bacterium]